MAPGASSQQAVDSYVALFKENTYGTYPATSDTGATFTEFMSNSFKTEIESQKLETMGHRAFTKRVQLNKNVAGALEHYLHPVDSVLLVANAMGGEITTTSLTSAYTHSIGAGQMNTTTSINSIAFNVKKGDTTFQYIGGRVNSMKITANVGEPVMASYDMIFKDSTQLSADISGSTALSEELPFTFVNGVFKYGASEGAEVAEEIVGFELTINNQLASDANARALGSNILSVLPPTRKDVQLTTTQRFDTTTAWDRFIQATTGSVEIVFTGQSISAEHNNALTIRLPKVYNNTPDPELGSATEILTSEISWDVVANTGTSAGREIGMTVINNVTSY